MIESTVTIPGPSVGRKFSMKPRHVSWGHADEPFQVGISGQGPPFFDQRIAWKRYNGIKNKTARLESTNSIEGSIYIYPYNWWLS